MTVFQFRTELSPDDPNLLDEVSGPILRAAYRVMVHAHTDPKTGQLVTRKKIDPSIPYIVHPIMVYDMLVAMGETDAVMLAAALLHDALEDNVAFRENHQLMRDMLVAEMKKEGVTDNEAHVFADEITELCAQVKNSKVRQEHKLNAQMKEIPFMSHEAKILKIADQTASLYDHLMMPNDLQAIPKQVSVEFAHKAHNLVRAIVHFKTAIEDGAPRRVTPTEIRELTRWDGFAHEVGTLNARLLRAQTAEEEEEARQRFRKRQPHLIRNARQPRRTENALGALDLRDGEIETTVEFPKKLTQEPLGAEPFPSEHCGLCRIALNGLGEVVRFTTWVAPDDSPKHPRNRISQQIVRAVAARRQVDMDDTQLHSVWLDTGEPPEGTLIENPDIPHINEGRRFILTLPMNVKDFLDTVTDEKVFGKQQVMTEEDIARVLARSEALRRDSLRLGRAGHAAGR